MNLLVLDKMRLLPERFATHVASERLLARVRAQVYFNIAFV